MSTEHVVYQEDAASLESVAECGRRLGRALREGDLVFLEGPLGAGKTTLVRAVADALSVEDAVRSPSFTIANIYKGAVRVQHLDLYRLGDMGEEDALALEEYAVADAVTLVEWPDSGRKSLGRPTWTVVMEHETMATRRVQIYAWTQDAARRWQEAVADE